jgi:hypothetical protein
MCQALQQNYASYINLQSDLTTDKIPGILLFGGTQCSGAFYPNLSGSFTSNTFTSGQTIVSSTWTGSGVLGGNIASFDIPFNFHSVLFTSVAGRTSTFIGPYYTTNTANVNWQQNNAATIDNNMFSDPVASVTFNIITDWPNQNVQPMCMGRSSYIGPYALTRFLPQSDRCDYFMLNTWYKQHPTNPENACFAELPAIQQKSTDLQVSLPVTCFGEKCSSTKAYRTFSMLSQPCNLTICQQTIHSSPGVFNSSTDTIYCGGQFFSATSDLPALPSVSPISTSSVTSTDTPFYTWLMLAVSAVLFLLLIYLLFAPRPIAVPTAQARLQHLIR